MARRPKPWFRKARRAWFVTLDGVQHNLGPDKAEAYERFYELMRQPQERRVASHLMAAIADAFLDWVQKQRSPETYEWFRYRLERFVQKYPDLRAPDIRPFHVETWVDDYQFTQTSRRNYLRSVKRCLKWAVKQGYLDRNPVVALEVPVGEHKEVVISAVEFDRLRTYIRNQNLADLVTVTWETGCRPQESLRVETRHVDLANRWWVIPKAESNSKRLVVHPRPLPVETAAIDVFEALLDPTAEGAPGEQVGGGPAHVQFAALPAALVLGQPVQVAQPFAHRVLAFAEQLSQARRGSVPDDPVGWRQAATVVR